MTALSPVESSSPQKAAKTIKQLRANKKHSEKANKIMQPEKSHIRSGRNSCHLKWRELPFDSTYYASYRESQTRGPNRDRLAGKDGEKFILKGVIERNKKEKEGKRVRGRNAGQDFLPAAAAAPAATPGPGARWCSGAGLSPAAWRTAKGTLPWVGGSTEFDYDPKI